ncbi:hypothetical protein H0H92_006700 [Tricholoma furcatifolium]|nr:hypothetical protein H0H92_006700 [Tricholoma furcatifolium]
MARNKKVVSVNATAIDVNAPRQTRNQRKAGETNPAGLYIISSPSASPHPKPRRRVPGKRTAPVDEPFIIQRASGAQPNVPPIPSDSEPPVQGVPPPPAVASATNAAPPIASAMNAAPAVDENRATPAPDPRNLFDEITPPPGNQRALQRPAENSPRTTPSRRSTHPTIEDMLDEDDPPSRRATPPPEDSESSSEEEDEHLPLPPGIDSFSDLGRNSKTTPAVKPGPIPAAAQEAAFLLHTQYQRTIEELADKHGKSPEAFYALL